MFINIVDAKYIEDFKVWFQFNDGTKAEIDMYDKIHSMKGIFEPLKNVENFKKFKVINKTISWENGADIAPDSIYKMISDNKN